MSSVLIWIGPVGNRVIQKPRILLLFLRSSSSHESKIYCFYFSEKKKGSDFVMATIHPVPTEGGYLDMDSDSDSDSSDVPLADLQRLYRQVEFKRREAASSKPKGIDLPMKG